MRASRAIALTVCIPIGVALYWSTVRAQSGPSPASRSTTSVVGTIVPASVSQSMAAQTATGATATITPGSGLVPKDHCIQLVATGTLVSCTYRLQGSNDGGTTWGDISASDITCTSSIIAFESGKPAKLIRGNLLTLSGTSPTITLHYSGR